MTTDVSIRPGARFVRHILRRMPTLLVSAMLMSAYPSVVPVWAQSEDTSTLAVFRIGVLATEGATRALESWTATANLLNRSAEAQEQPYQFKIAPQTLGSLAKAVEEGHVDLLLTDPASFAAAEVENGARAILSAARMWDGGSYDLTGALVFTRADRQYRRLDELSGRRIMAVAPNDFGGWWLAEQEFRKHRIEPKDFLDEVVFSGGNQREVVYAVQTGLVDAGVVRAGVLEGLARQGAIDLKDFVPISLDISSDYPFWVSTPLYPEWVLSALPNVPEEVLALVINTLLTVTPDNPASIVAGGAVWQAPQNYQQVHDLLISLRARPYENYLAQAGNRIFKAYRWPILGTVAAIALSLAFLAYQARRNMQLAEAGRDVLKSEVRSKKFYRSAIEEHTVFCMLTLGGEISHVNERFIQTSDRPGRELLGQPLSMFLSGRDQEVLATEIMSSMQVGVPWNGPLQIFKEDGSSAWVQCSFIPVTGAEGKLNEIAVVATDMTTTHDNISEEQFNDTLELIQDQVIVLRPETLEILYCNRTAEQLFIGDRAVRSWKGKTASDFITQQDLKILQTYSETVIKGPMRRMTWEVSATNGTEYEITLEYVQSDSGEPRLVSIYHDITARKAADTAKKEFISTVSHELRTPLTSMKGALGLALSGSIGEIPEKVSKMVTMASSNCDRLVILINDILDLEKIEAGKMNFKMEELDLEELVDAAIEANRFYAEKYGVTLTRRTEDIESGYITLGDRNRLMQVMDNLLSNAAKYSPKDKEVVISLSLNRGWIRLSVSDHGPGIPKAAQATIFNKFTQADSSDTRAKGGTGLGLSIAKLIVVEHKGRIFFESEESFGTEFFADLPRIVGNVITPVTGGLSDEDARFDDSENGQTMKQNEDLLRLLLGKLQRDGVEVVLENGRMTTGQMFGGKGTLNPAASLQWIRDGNRTLIAGLIARNILGNNPISVLESTVPGTGKMVGASGSEQAVLDWLAELPEVIDETASKGAALSVLGVASKHDTGATFLAAGLPLADDVAQAVLIAGAEAFDVILQIDQTKDGKIVTILPVADGRLAGRLPVTLVVERNAAAKTGQGVVSKFSRRTPIFGRGQSRRQAK
jgi:PAS domain S-box-containing protein